VDVFVALLRGINVGGNNLIRMPALKACFEAQGLCQVTTYIQSGNVVFADASHPDALTARLETALSRTFAYRARVAVRSLDEMKQIVARAPRGFGKRPAAYRYDVVYLKEALSAKEALKSIPAKPGVDRVVAGGGVLYCSRLISKAAQSGMSRVVGTPAYQNMTIRNWNTTTKLLDLMENIRSHS
jgi:uncharacterized protein (DUF1697 family)